MARFQLKVDGATREVDAPAEMPLLWVLRDLCGVHAVKYGCGVAQCRACTVHLGGEAVPSCQIAVGDVGDRAVTTVAGLGDAGAALEQAWIAEEVPQCGYCQPGQLMAAAALLAKTPHPSDDEIDAAMINICRCATYNRIRRAIHRAAGSAR